METAELPPPAFCGVDWAEDRHDVAIVDADGKQLAKARISDDAAGFTQLIALLSEHVGPLLALRQRQRFRPGTVLIVDGTLVPTRAHNVAEQSKNYRYSTNHQVVDADTRMVVVVGRPVPGNRNDCRAWDLSGARASVGRTTVIADGGYRGTGLI